MVAVGEAVLQLFLKVCFGETTTIGGGKDPAVLGEAVAGELHETVVVALHGEGFAFVIARESGGIEDDAIKGAPLASEAFEPVEGVAFAKIVLCWLEVVVEKILPSPVEIRL